MKKKRIIFFTVEVGLAHMVRSIAVAEALADRGHEVLFALPKIQQKQFIKHKKIIPLTVGEFMSKDDIRNAQVFTKINRLLPFAQEELNLIKKHQPDTAIVDFRFSAIASTLAADIPTYYLCGSGGLPYGCQLPNPGYPHFLHPLITPLILSTVWKAKLKYLKAIHQTALQLGSTSTLDEMIRRMHCIVPEAEGYLQANDRSIHVDYAGHIWWPHFDQEIPDWLKTVKRTGKTVYVSFGGTGFAPEKLIELSRALAVSGFEVIVSAGSIVDTADFPKLPNLHVARYIAGDEVAKRVDAIICHGGYGTLMQAVYAKIPFVAVPFNPDQLLHSLRMQELGFGKCLTSFSQLVKKVDDWENFLNAGKSISNDIIIATLQSVLEQKEEYSASIKNKTREWSAVNGATRAAEIIERGL